MLGATRETADDIPVWSKQPIRTFGYFLQTTVVSVLCPCRGVLLLDLRTWGSLHRRWETEHKQPSKLSCNRRWYTSRKMRNQSGVRSKDTGSTCFGSRAPPGISTVGSNTTRAIVSWLFSSCVLTDRWNHARFRMYVLTGAICAEARCVVDMHGNTYFGNNSARFHGGKNGHEKTHILRRVPGRAFTRKSTVGIYRRSAIAWDSYTVLADKMVASPMYVRGEGRKLCMFPQVDIISPELNKGN